jgi:hypothetical protein
MHGKDRMNRKCASILHDGERGKALLNKDIGINNSRIFPCSWGIIKK